MIAGASGFWMILEACLLRATLTEDNVSSLIPKRAEPLCSRALWWDGRSWLETPAGYAGNVKATNAEATYCT